MTLVSPNPPHRDYLMVLLVAGLASAAFQGSRPLWETTEGRYAEVAREMLARRDLLVPHLEGRPHWTKPPLAYWALAGAMSTLGTSPWAVRFPNVLFFTFSALLVVRVGSRLRGARVGALAGLVYATAPYGLLAAHSVSTDMLLALTELGTVACWLEARAAATCPEVAQRWRDAAWVCAALSFLTKGPPGLLSLAVILGWEWKHPSPGEMLLTVRGLGAFSLVALPWFLLVLARNPELLSYWLSDELAGRILSDHSQRNPEWYSALLIYLPPLTVGMGPWLIGASRARSGDASAFDDFLACWLLGPLAVFALAKSRLWLYVLPLAAPLAVLLAERLVDLARSRLALLAVLSLALGVGPKAWVALTDPKPWMDMALLATRAERLGAQGACEVATTEDFLYGFEYHSARILVRVWSWRGDPRGRPWVGDWVTTPCPRVGRPGWRIVVGTGAYAAPLRGYLAGKTRIISEDVDAHWALFKVECPDGGG